MPVKMREKIPDLYNYEEFYDAKKLYLELMSIDTSDISEIDISSSALLIDYISLLPDKISFESFHAAVIDILEKTLPYLSAREMRDIWGVISGKTGDKRFTGDEQLWMKYFQALCNYNMPALEKFSQELLPQDGSIEDYYINRMLITSMLVSSYCLGDSLCTEGFYNRFEGKKNPGFMIRLLRNLD